MVSRITADMFLLTLHRAALSGVLSVLFLLWSASAWGAEVVTTTETVEVKSGEARLVLSKATGQPADGGLTVTEGPQAHAVEFGPATKWQVNDDTVTVEFEDLAGTMQAAIAVTAADSLRLDIMLRNLTDQQRLVEVSYAVPVRGEDLRWWDGMNENTPQPPRFSALGMTLRFPLSAVYNERHGVGIGVDPLHLLSTFATGAQAYAEGLMPSFMTRLVIDPHDTVTLPLYIVDFVPRFGHLDAVQRVCELHPAAFSRTAGVRPLIVGGGGYLFSSRQGRHLQWEEARRYGMGWEWAYCPAQIPGDWYASEEFYDPERGYAGDRDRHVNAAKGSLEEYRRDMRERFHNGWPATVVAFYLLPHAADLVVLEKYPEAVIVDGKGNISTIHQGWIKTDSTTRMAYPWGNAYGEKVVADIRRIAEDFRPGAIGFDEANINLAHYGAGIEGEPGRAWTEDGAYAGTQVALGRIGDAIHQTTVNGYTLATVFNKPHTYNTATRADVALHEWPPYTNIDSLEPLRLLAGHKQLGFWYAGGLERVVKWEELTPAQIREAAIGIAAFQRLSSLRYGAFPHNLEVFGHRQLVEVMPVLSELLREGWQPTPAARTDDALWLSRYGTGVRSFLAVGNPTRTDQPARLRLYPEYFGSGALLFSDYTGQPLHARYAVHDAEVDLGVLPMHGHAVARALVSLPFTAEVAVEGRAEYSHEAKKEGFVRARWNAASPAEGLVAVRLPDGATPLALHVNGAAAEFTLHEGTVQARMQVPARGELELLYAPRVALLAAPEAIIDFPFLQNGQAHAVIELPQGATDQDVFTARRISAYFEWYFRRQTTEGERVRVWDLHDRGPEVALAVVEAGQAPAGVAVVKLQAAPGNAAISADSRRQRLVLRGADSEAREAAMLRLLGLLDRKYEYYGVLFNSPAYDKAGLTGTTLP